MSIREMKMCRMFVLLVVLMPLARAAQGSGVNPLATVFKLLTDLKLQIYDDMDSQEQAYRKYADWCKKTAGEGKYEIETSNARKSDLTAKVSKLSADIEVGDTKIKDLAAAISKAETELKEATAIRKKEAEEFVAAEKELVTTVSTLENALSQLEKQTNAGKSFAQLDTSMLTNVMEALSVVSDAAALSSSSESALEALVQSHEDREEEPGAPAAAVYKKQSGSIMDVIEDMKEKSENQLQELRQSEMKAKQSYALLKQSLDDQIKADTEELNAEKSGKSEAQEEKASSEGGLEVAKKEVADSSKKISELALDCQLNAADHQANVAARKEELKTLDETEKILKESTGGAAQVSGYSLLQLTVSSSSRQRSRAMQLAQATVIKTVKRLAEEQHSKSLAQLASRISAQFKYGQHTGADPFMKVKNLIVSMIKKLEKEASSEATEKAYCDAELPKAKDKSSDLQDSVAKLTAKTAKAASQSSKLKQEVAETTVQLSALAKEDAEIDRIRREEHAAHLVAKKDLEHGLSGVRRALTTLRDYYGSQQNSASLLQEDDSADDDRGEMASMMQQASRQPAPPQKSKKSVGAGSSILNLLEVVESDFAKNLATEDTEETDAQTTYEKLKQKSSITKSQKEVDVDARTREFKALDNTISNLEKDKATEVEELQAVMTYHAKIKERCIAKPTSYEEMKARREAEITGLKEALASLESEALLQTRSNQAAPGRRGWKALRGDATSLGVISS